MNWAYALLSVAAALAGYRVYLAFKKAQQGDGDDWDERLVKNLRAQGGTAFRDYEIDFFFGVPTRAACEALATELQSDGCKVDFREASTEGASGFTLAAHKSMRVSVPEMQAHSTRYRALAAEHASSYDGWATEGITRQASDNVRLRPKGIPRRFG